jgi:hypothetical protein
VPSSSFDCKQFRFTAAQSGFRSRLEHAADDWSCLRLPSPSSWPLYHGSKVKALPVCHCEEVRRRNFDRPLESEIYKIYYQSNWLIFRNEIDSKEKQKKFDFDAVLCLFPSQAPHFSSTVS